jgi:hypothetical protein
MKLFYLRVCRGSHSAENCRLFNAKARPEPFYGIRCGNDCASSNGAPRAALRRQSDLKFEAAFPHFHPTATRL